MKEGGSINEFNSKSWFFRVRNFYENRQPVEAFATAAKKRVHPNTLSGVRPLLGIIGPIVNYSISPLAGASSKITGLISDVLDGLLARKGKPKLTSQEGAALDPFCDKAEDIPWLVCIASERIHSLSVTPNIVDALQIIAIANLIGVNIYSQLKRGPFPFNEQIQQHIRAVFHPETCEITENTRDQAHYLGKTKYALESVGILAAILFGNNETAQTVATLLFGTAAVSGLIGIRGRLATVLENEGGISLEKIEK